MTGKELLELGDRLHSAIRRGMEECTDIQHELDYELREGCISFEEWKGKIKEIEERLKFYGEQIDIYDRLLKKLKEEL